MRLILSALLLFAAIGCAKDPFRPTNLTKLSNPDPAAMVEQFRATQADRFTSEDSVIIHAPFRDDLALLGVTKVDRNAGTFEFVGLNQMGVEYFSVSGDSTGVRIRSAVPPLLKHKDILLSIARDIWRMHSYPLPGKEAQPAVFSQTIRFTERTKDGKHTRTFGGEPGVLLEKKETGWLGTHWKIRYFEYALKDGKQYPRGIILNNGHYHYRITLRNRDWQSP